MNETRHIKLNFEEALNAKKQLLSTELNIIHILKRVKTYKVLRKKELTTRSKLKTTTTSLKSKLNLILSTFPKEEKKPKHHKKAIQKKQDITGDLSKELEEIEKKLARLS